MRKIELWYGALLHDVGKILFRSKKELANGTHSYLGGEYIQNFPDLKDRVGIVQSIKYHHFKELKSARIDNNSLAYITYIADNIASGIDRRDITDLDDFSMKFDKSVALQSVFNILNGNKQTHTYEFKTNEFINYPINKVNTVSSSEYSRILDEMNSFHSRIKFSETHFNSLLQWTESYWSFIPSSTATNQLVDISLFDHSKITCAVASCIFDYLESKGINDYYTTLFVESQDFYNKDAFLLLSLDLSGIQDFIYNISGEKALKSLKARSFYLEMTLEVIIDMLLDQLGYSRANLLYSGGGHVYALIANTEKNKTTVKDFEAKIKEWLLNQFKTDLFLAFAYCDCSGKDLMNSDNNYKNIWKQVSHNLSLKKLNRYTVQDIVKLNTIGNDHERECKECLRSDSDIIDGYCSFCNDLINFSSKLHSMTNTDFICVGFEGDLILPFNYKLSIKSKKNIEININQHYKIYSKNNPHIGESIATNLWISNYFVEKEIDKYAKLSEGINRLGVLRADVDNLGRAFTSGISDMYNSLSRITTLSRKLSMFFKHGIDQLLKENNFLATVIYAGGDDLFIIGAWDDVIDLSILIREEFTRYTQGTLTLSAGIGMYRSKYPLYKMASETGELEDLAKQETKNRLTLWSSEKVYQWDILKDNIINQKYRFIVQELSNQNDHNKAFVYKVITLLRDDSKINIARLAYLLGRSKLSDNFSKKMFEWSNDKEERKYLVTALEYYVYKTRKEQE